MCSGQLIERSINLISQIFDEKIPDKVTCQPAENLGMIFTNDKGKEYRFEQNGLNVWRSSFDGWLTEMAVQSGVEIRDNTSAVDCVQNEENVTVAFKENNNIYTEHAKYVIDCEGVIGHCDHRERTPALRFRRMQGRECLHCHYLAILQTLLGSTDTGVADGFAFLHCTKGSD